MVPIIVTTTENKNVLINPLQFISAEAAPISRGQTTIHLTGGYYYDIQQSLSWLYDQLTANPI